MTGTLYGVGVGPGDAELMTIKAIKTIDHCDIIAVPTSSNDGTSIAYNIALQAFRELANKECMFLDLPMTRDPLILKAKQNLAANLICEELDNDKDIAFLTLGDPTVYSTYIYIHRIVKHMGYKTKIIPGIPSFCAAAAALDISLTEADQPIHVIPGSYDCMEESIDLTGTKVIMKAGRSLSKVRSMLKERNMLSETKMVQNCGMDNEKLYKNMEQVPDTSAYFSILVVKEKIIGGSE